VNGWLIAFTSLLPPLALSGWHVFRGSVGGRLVAVELAFALATMMLVMASYGFDQPSFIDLPLALALLSVPGTLSLAHFLERWL